MRRWFTVESGVNSPPPKFLLLILMILVVCKTPGSLAQQDQALCADVVQKSGTVRQHADCMFGIFPSPLTWRKAQDGTLLGVSTTKHTMSYAGLDSISAFQAKEEVDSSCHVKLARMANKFGTVVSASSDSAQAAVRANSATLRNSPDCPGFGLCAEIMDAGAQTECVYVSSNMAVTGICISKKKIVSIPFLQVIRMCGPLLLSR